MAALRPMVLAAAAVRRAGPIRDNTLDNDWVAVAHVLATVDPTVEPTDSDGQPAVFFAFLGQQIGRSRRTFDPAARRWLVRHQRGTPLGGTIAPHDPTTYEFDLRAGTTSASAVEDGAIALIELRRIAHVVASGQIQRSRWEQLVAHRIGDPRGAPPAGTRVAVHRAHTPARLPRGPRRLTMSPDNHITVLWAAKGGSGTTVTTAAAALHEVRDVVIVDLRGDMTDVLATPWPAVGLDDWLLGEPANPIDDLVVDVDPATRLLPTRSPIDLDQVSGEGVGLLHRSMRGTSAIVLVDAGTGPPADALLEIADRNLMVTRPCYLALMKSVRSGLKPDGVVLVNEASRSLNPSSVEHCVSAPIVATIDVHPSIARSVDAGLLTGGHAHGTRTTAAITRPDPIRKAGRPVA